MAHPYTPYCPTFHYRGRYNYLLTFVTFERSQAFTDPIGVRIARSNILRAAIEQRFEIIVYCFMPDHVHLIVDGLAHDSDLKRLVKLAKQYSATTTRAPSARSCGNTASTTTSSAIKSTCSIVFDMSSITRSQRASWRDPRITPSLDRSVGPWRR